MRRMLIEQLQAEGIRDPRVLAALERVPREKFVLENLQQLAYENTSLPIGCEQTISQPYVVARMSELILSAGQTRSVLEIGTGSGYQAAILAQLFERVYTIERIRELYDTACERFQRLGYANIHTLYGDGFLGWPEHSPYDAIIVTAAAARVPQTLLDQLSPETGRLVMPVGEFYDPPQRITLITRQGDDLQQIWLDAVRFVPMQHGLEEK